MFVFKRNKDFNFPEKYRKYFSRLDSLDIIKEKEEICEIIIIGYLRFLNESKISDETLGETIPLFSGFSRNVKATSKELLSLFEKDENIQEFLGYFSSFNIPEDYLYGELEASGCLEKRNQKKS